MSDVHTKAMAYFMQPSGFLTAFAKNAKAAIATLEADPRAYGLRRPELGAIERDNRLKSLLAAARRSSKTTSPPSNQQ